MRTGMRRAVVAAVLLVLVLRPSSAWSSSAPPLVLSRPHVSYANCAVLDGARDVQLAWTVVPDQRAVHIALWAPVPAGWLAVGVSEDGWMSGGTRGFSEVWLASSSTKPGSLCHGTCLLDGTVSSYAPPELDASAPASLQDVVVSKNATTLVAEFTRALDTHKPSTDYVLSLSAPTKLIWAVNPTKPVDSLQSMAYHRSKGSATVHFGLSRPCPSFGPSATPTARQEL